MKTFQVLCQKKSSWCYYCFLWFNFLLLIFTHSVCLCSLKREIRKLAQDECGYEEPTVAMAFVYFEKLVLQGKLNKQNRKLCAGACVLLAAKIGGDLKKHEVKLLIDVRI